MNDLQPIFTRVASHLLTQMAKSHTARHKCAYRGEGGRKCAVGVLIADEHYSDSLESWPVVSGSVELALTRSGIDCTDWKTVDFLSRLQSIHDRFDPADWREQLSEVAALYNLQMEAPA